MADRGRTILNGAGGAGKSLTELITLGAGIEAVVVTGVAPGKAILKQVNNKTQ